VKLAFEDGEFAKAIELLTYRDRIDMTILESLESTPNAYKNAFEKLSRNTRIIYVHAYQSYIFNKAVSLRVREFGDKVLAGDLIIVKDKQIAIKEDTFKKGRPSVEKTIIPDPEVLTEDRAKEVSIYDVVFPLIGKSVRLPDN